MCGRFTMTSPSAAITGRFGVPDPENPRLLAKRYNIAPTQDVAAVRAAEGAREIVALHWGLVPSWAKDRAIGSRMINARAETVAEKPSFRAAFKKRRCLVVADGYYEWQRRTEGKQPYLIGLRDGEPFAFAGLWERWSKEDEPLESCTIITTAANELTRPIHDRMPVILAPDSYERWLDPSFSDRGALEALLRPFDDRGMRAFAVSTWVNDARHNDERCVQPLD